MSDNQLDKLYRKALKSAVKERRRSSGGKRLSADERGFARYQAKQAAQDPVYAALERGEKIIPPSEAEVKKRQKRHALKEHVRSYRSGWGRKKVAPEHRGSLLEAVKRSSEGTTFIPHKTLEEINRARRFKTKVKLGRLNGEWMRIDKVKGAKGDGDPYLIAPGIGYDAIRLVVYADSQDVAYEIAQETWPKMMFSHIISNSRHDKLDGNAWDEDPDNYEFIDKLDKWGIPEQDIRIFQKLKEVTHNARALDAPNMFRLPDGRIVEAR